MIRSIVRCPSHFFDTTPSGILINKFSNDLGVLDSALSFSFIFTLEGPALTLVALINVCLLSTYMIAPTIVIFILCIVFFLYCRKALIQTKQRDLKNKSPIFHFYNETINGLVQVKTYNRRRSLINEFSGLVNDSTRAAISFDIVSRGFGFYITLMCLFLFFIGF